MATLRQSLRELSEDFQSRFAGLRYSVDTIPTTQVVQKQLIKLRSQAIRMMFMPSGTDINKNFLAFKVVRPLRYNLFWCLQADLKKASTYQPSFGDLDYGFARFPCPPVISINGEMDGFLSVAGAQQNCMYHRLSGGFEGWMNLKRKGTCITRKYWWYSDGAINTNDLSVQYLHVRACPEDPTEWQTWDSSTNSYKYVYDPNNDPFLVTSEVIGAMEYLFKANYMNPLLPVDNSANQIPNSNENKQQNG